MLLTGGPSLRAVGRLAGLRIPAGAARHTVAVLEPHPAFAVERMPMVFDIGAGLYWRLEEGGLLFGWSDPDEQPGEARSIDWAAYERWRERLAGFVPLTRDLGAARDLGGDDRLHARPPADPRARRSTPDGDRIEGVTVASAGRPRDDVGTRRRPRRRRPALRGRTDADRRRPTSASTASMPRAGAAWRPTRSRCRSPSSAD